MIPLLQSIPAAVANKKIKRFLDVPSVGFEEPYRLFHWHTLINESKSFFKENFLQFLIFLSGGIAAFHCKRILKAAGTFMYRENDPDTLHLQNNLNYVRRPYFKLPEGPCMYMAGFLNYHHQSGKHEQSDIASLKKDSVKLYC